MRYDYDTLWNVLIDALGKTIDLDENEDDIKFNDKLHDLIDITREFVK
jgi:hypothetical protein